MHKPEYASSAPMNIEARSFDEGLTLPSRFMSKESVVPERATSQCTVCNDTSLEIFRVREMQIGLREVFEYGRCDRCGAISRLSRVHSMSPYYPSSYYSYLQESMKPKEPRFKSWLRIRRDRALLTRALDPVGRFLGWVSKETTALYRLVGLCKPRLTSRVLDVGCGSGRLLRRMAEVGFQNLIGIDLFAPEDVTCDEENFRILKGDLALLCGQRFDVIMMHHCFEHFDDQAAQLRLARDLMTPKSLLLIRQPLSDGEAFQKYGAHWFQLDAPRHATLHSINSMRLLVQECGLRIRNIIWDSTDQQFWASEQYVSNLPMYSEDSYFRKPEEARFTDGEIRKWKREAAKLNRDGRGDQAAFYIEQQG